MQDAFCVWVDDEVDVAGVANQHEGQCGPHVKRAYHKRHEVLHWRFYDSRSQLVVHDRRIRCVYGKVYLVWFAQFFERLIEPAHRVQRSDEKVSRRKRAHHDTDRDSDKEHGTTYSKGSCRSRVTINERSFV